MIVLDKLHYEDNGKLSKLTVKELEIILDSYKQMIEAGLDSQEDIIAFILLNFDNK